LVCLAYLPYLFSVSRTSKTGAYGEVPSHSGKYHSEFMSLSITTASFPASPAKTGTKDNYECRHQRDSGSHLTHIHCPSFYFSVAASYPFPVAGLMSKTGVPSRMSRPLMRITSPSTPRTSTIDIPMGFGLIGEQILNTPRDSFR